MIKVLWVLLSAPLAAAHEDATAFVQTRQPPRVPAEFDEPLLDTYTEKVDGACRGAYPKKLQNRFSKAARTARECQEACDGASGCQAIGFHKTGQMTYSGVTSACWLSSSCTATQATVGAETFHSFFKKPDQYEKAALGTCTEGYHTLTPRNRAAKEATTLWQCKEACDSTRSCLSAAWAKAGPVTDNTVKSQCWLAQECTPDQLLKNFDTYESYFKKTEFVECGASNKVNDFSSESSMKAAGWVFSKYDVQLGGWKPSAKAKQAPSGSFFGWGGGHEEMGLELTLVGEGTVTLKTGNTEGSEGVKVFLNGEQEGSSTNAGQYNQQQPIFAFENGDILKIGGCVDCVMVISEIQFACASTALAQVPVAATVDASSNTDTRTFKDPSSTRVTDTMTFKVSDPAQFAKEAKVNDAIKDSVAMLLGPNVAASDVTVNGHSIKNGDISFAYSVNSMFESALSVQSKIAAWIPRDVASKLSSMITHHSVGHAGSISGITLGSPVADSP